MPLNTPALNVSPPGRAPFVRLITGEGNPEAVAENDCCAPTLSVALAGLVKKGACVLVSEKAAGVAASATDAFTVYKPAVPFAVNEGAVATPSVFVITVLTPPANEPLGPADGAAKLTVAPATG